jgi:hypothetical protein
MTDPIRETVAEVGDIVNDLSHEFGLYQKAGTIVDRVGIANELYLLATQLLEETAKLVCLEKGEDP